MLVDFVTRNPNKVKEQVVILNSYIFDYTGDTEYLNLPLATDLFKDD